jgi:hypothetical protein
MDIEYDFLTYIHYNLLKMRHNFRIQQQGTLFDGMYM